MEENVIYMFIYWCIDYVPSDGCFCRGRYSVEQKIVQ